MQRITFGSCLQHSKIKLKTAYNKVFNSYVPDHRFFSQSQLLQIRRINEVKVFVLLKK